MHDTGSVRLTAAVRLQLEGAIFEEFEDWRREQPKIPSRSEALRLLLERGLAAGPDRPRNSTQKSETVPATSPT
jgi:hypothetical protein